MVVAGSPRREHLECVCECVGVGGATSWSSAGIHTTTAGAKPILSFSRSKTVKYSLRKTSPRIQRVEWLKVSSKLL